MASRRQIANKLRPTRVNVSKPGQELLRCFTPFSRTPGRRITRPADHVPASKPAEFRPGASKAARFRLRYASGRSRYRR